MGPLASFPEAGDPERAFAFEHICGARSRGGNLIRGHGSGAFCSAGRDLVETNFLPPAADSFVSRVGVMRMSNEMKIDVALANLEAGKFSFKMVDAIKDHVSKLESELEVLRGLQDSAIHDLKKLEYANWRLEGDLTKLNAKVYALLRANMLTERACLESSRLAAKAREAVGEMVRLAGTSWEWAKTELNAENRAILLLEAKKATEKARREATPYAIKAGEYLDVVKKWVAATQEKATAYISALNKNAA
jgi:hypothetical protein